jgi:hypothetical protein
MSRRVRGLVGVVLGVAGLASAPTALAQGPPIYSGGGVRYVRTYPAGHAMPRAAYGRGVGFSYQAGYAGTVTPPVWPGYRGGIGYGYGPAFAGAYGPGGFAWGGYWSGANPAFGYGYPGYGFGSGGYGYLGGYPVGPLGVGTLGYPGFGAGFGSAAAGYGYQYRGFYPW